MAVSKLSLDTTGSDEPHEQPKALTTADSHTGLDSSCANTRAPRLAGQRPSGQKSSTERSESHVRSRYPPRNLDRAEVLTASMTAPVTGSCGDPAWTALVPNLCTGDGARGGVSMGSSNLVMIEPRRRVDGRNGRPHWSLWSCLAATRVDWSLCGRAGGSGGLVNEGQLSARYL